MNNLVVLGWPRVWAVTRWVAVGAALPLVWACNARTLEAPRPNPVRVVTNTFQATLNRELDILFMVDNSQSMASLQNKLIMQFPVFMDVLKALPNGDGSGTGLPDIHVAVISSDTGPGKFDLGPGTATNYHCAFGGDGGRFQTLPRLSCTTSPLQNGQTFLSASMNQAVKNYNGDITDAFSCIAALGDQGCGFEGQLKSVRWALDPLATPDTNLGFLRPEAFLAVILITNEDDCSVPDDSDLIDPTAGGIATYGPLVSYRCNEFGHLCNINGTLQPPPRTGVINNITGCVSNEPPNGTTGKLTRVADEVAFLKGLKADPNQIFVAAITGPVTPYSIGPDPTTPTMDQAVMHSCTQATTGLPEYADPAVRIQQWVEAFGSHGLAQTICAPSFAPSLMSIAQELSKLLGPQCIADNLVDTDVSTAAVDAQCQMTDQYVDNGQAFSKALPACASNNNSPPCWSLDVDPVKCPGPNLILKVNRGGGALPSGLSTTVSCAMCIPGVAKAGCPCIASNMVAGCK